MGLRHNSCLVSSATSACVCVTLAATSDWRRLWSSRRRSLRTSASRISSTARTLASSLYTSSGSASVLVEASWAGTLAPTLEQGLNKNTGIHIYKLHRINQYIQI